MTVPAVLCMLTGGLPQQVTLPSREELPSAELPSAELLEQWLTAGYVAFLEPGVEPLEDLDDASQNIVPSTISEETADQVQGSEEHGYEVRGEEVAAGGLESRSHPGSSKRLRGISVARDRGMSVARSRGVSMQQLWTKPPVQWHVVTGVASGLKSDELRPIAESGTASDWPDDTGTDGATPLDDASAAAAPITSATTIYVRSIVLEEASTRTRPHASSISHAAASNGASLSSFAAFGTAQSRIGTKESAAPLSSPELELTLPDWIAQARRARWPSCWVISLSSTSCVRPPIGVPPRSTAPSKRPRRRTRPASVSSSCALRLAWRQRPQVEGRSTRYLRRRLIPFGPDCFSPWKFEEWTRPLRQARRRRRCWRRQADARQERHEASRARRRWSCERLWRCSMRRERH